MTAEALTSRTVHADALPEDWWRHAVVYQVYPRSFADGNGDGEGDVAGVRARLPYIASLGVQAIWFNPFYPSPLRDGGYDVADYRGVHPDFGTLADVEAMIAEAHDLGIKVLLDVVPNHTSWDHPWFREAMATDPGSDAWSRYHCVRGRGENGSEPPNNWRSVFAGSAWTPIERDGSPTGWWYLNLFDSSQPDLNWEHPEVRAEFEDILRFWFDRGVDGFRIDVAHGLIKAPGYPDYAPEDDHAHELLDPDPLPHWDQPGIHEIYRRWRSIADSYEPKRVLVGEVWVGTEERLAAYLRPDELHVAFNFSHLRAPWDASEQRRIISTSLAANDRVGAPTTWVLENHDTVRAASRYAGVETEIDSESGVPTHLPARVLTQQEKDLGLARARALLLLTLALPGSTYVYQGQELGLDEVIDLPPDVRQDPVWFRSSGAIKGRDGCRVPMPWTNSGVTLGFNASGRSWLPMPAQWAPLSVESQERDPESTLALTRSAVHVRALHDALVMGDLRWRDDLMTAHPDVLAFERVLADGAPVLVALNFGTTPVSINATDLLIASRAVTSTADGWALPANTAAWWIS